MSHYHADTTCKDGHGLVKAANIGLLLALAAITIASCAGCGGGGGGNSTISTPAPPTPPPPPPVATSCASGYTNQSAFSTAILANTWGWAADQLANPGPKGIPMNPLAPGGATEYYPAQPNALSIQPSCEVTVATLPDVPWASLPAAWQAVIPNNGLPTGVFVCPSGTNTELANVGYCEAVTEGVPGNNTIIVASSVTNVNTGLVNGTLGWEMQNVILERIIGFVPIENGWDR